MPEYLELAFKIAGEQSLQRARVRPAISVEDMIAEIAAEFDVSEPADYELYQSSDTTRPLPRSQSLSKAGIQTGETLVFMRPAMTYRRPIQAKQTAVLRLQDSEKEFPIQWQPAIIGRPDADSIHASLLAVNLDWHPARRRVSRQHAQITEQDGIYYIESLARNNPTMLNNDRLVTGERYPLKNNDTIYLRNSKVALRLQLREPA